MELVWIGMNWRIYVNDSCFNVPLWYLRRFSSLQKGTPRGFSSLERIRMRLNRVFVGHFSRLWVKSKHIKTGSFHFWMTRHPRGVPRGLDLCQALHHASPFGDLVDRWPWRGGGPRESTRRGTGTTGMRWFGWWSEDVLQIPERWSLGESIQSLVVVLCVFTSFRTFCWLDMFLCHLNLGHESVWKRSSLVVEHSYWGSSGILIQ